MQINQIPNYQTYTYNTAKTSNYANGTVKANDVTFTGKINIEPDNLVKKIKDFFEVIKSSYASIKAKKVEKTQTIIDIENNRQLQEEARRVAIAKKREETLAIARKNLEEERRLRQELSDQRIESYKKANPESLAKEYRRLLEENDIVWSARIKQILKSKGYALLDGEAVKEYSRKAYRPLEILPIDDIPNSTYAARMIHNPPLVQSSDIMTFPARGNYSLDNIGVYNFNIAQRHFGQIRFPGTKFSANTGMEIPGAERGWTMAHSYRPNLIDYDKYHYCTTLSYRHEANYLGQAPGFSFVIDGEISAKELDEIKNIFIDSGLMEKLLKSAGNREEAINIFQEMAEIIVKQLNGVSSN